MSRARRQLRWRVFAVVSIAAMVCARGEVYAHASAVPTQRRSEIAVEIYPVEDPNPAVGPTLFVADGGVWALSGEEVHRVDLGVRPLTGYLDASWFSKASPRRIDRGMYWTLVVDQSAPPCTSAIPEEDPNLPYVLHGIEVATDTLSRIVPIPGWCAFRPSRSMWDGEPAVAAAGGIVWVGRPLPPGPGEDVGGASVRVDAASGSVTGVASSRALLTFAADDHGAWAYTLSASGIHTVETTLGQSLLTLEVARVSLDGTVVATDMLRGAVIDVSTVAVDPDGLWVVTAMPPKRPAAHPDQTLTRVTTSGRRVVSPGVRAWSVASGDGQTWFVGTTHPLPKTLKGQALDWVLGRVDTRTGKLLGTYHLDLPGDLGHVIHGPEISLLGVTGGAVWLRTGQGAGTLVRVTVRPTRAN